MKDIVYFIDNIIYSFNNIFIYLIILIILLKALR